MPPCADNLRESTRRVVRLVALGHLVDAAAARNRLADSTDSEALHDFRVALRRLRSWERAFRPYVRDDLSPKLRRRLRNLARDTSASRNLEVHVAWLAEQRKSLGRRQRPGLKLVLADLERRKAEADSVLERDVEGRFSRLHSKLERALASYRETLQLRDGGRAGPPAPFAEALAPRLREMAEELRDHLARVHSVDDVHDGHEARIATKRTRYLLEPIAKLVPGATELVDRLRSLQDVLGDLHDAQLFGAEIEALAAGAKAEASARSISLAAVTAAPTIGVTAPIADAVSDAPGAAPVPHSVDAAGGTAPPDEAVVVTSLDALPSERPPAQPAAPDPMPGLTAIAARLRERAHAAFAQFTPEWTGEHADDFFRDVDTVATSIAHAATAGLEIERKYLLRCLPDEARDGRRADIEQGYVPGERLQERVRRVVVRGGSGRTDVRFYRTVKLGDGIARTEIEEETTAEIFEALWPLTKGHRLRKRRYLVEVGDRTWEIDEFRNRDLVLAEIELGSEDERVDFPPWLAPVVEREVTTEAEYRNINLAR